MSRRTEWWLNNFQLQGKANLNLCSRFQNIISCCNIGSLGSALSRSFDRKTAWQGGKKTGIKQFPGIKSSENDTDDFHKFERVKNSPPTNEQSNRPDILGQNEDDRES